MFCFFTGKPEKVWRLKAHHTSSSTPFCLFIFFSLHRSVSRHPTFSAFSFHANQTLKSGWLPLQFFINAVVACFAWSFLHTPRATNFFSWNFFPRVVSGTKQFLRSPNSPFLFSVSAGFIWIGWCIWKEQIPRLQHVKKVLVIVRIGKKFNNWPKIMV